MNKKHLLNDVWEKLKSLGESDCVNTEDDEIRNSTIDFNAIGPSYDYTLNIINGTIKNLNNNALKIHGLVKKPEIIEEIFSLIHPDDLEFVRRAEIACSEKVFELGFDKVSSLKISYCFRMSISDGSYHLFNHQSFHLNSDENGKLKSAINVHTDINHITSINNYIATVQGINGCKEFHLIDVYKNQSIENVVTKLSKRELEIICLIAEGLSSKQISERLFISIETVRVHRRNMLKKTKTNNSINLVKICIENSLL